MPRGGARPGAGRKSKRQTHERAINAAEKKCADRLPQTLQNLFQIADGGFEIVTETWEPAGLLTVDDTEIIDTEHGPRSVKVKRLAFPNVENPSTLVLVKRTVRVAAPDLSANQYLADRILGSNKPRGLFDDMTDEELKAEAARLFGGDASEGDTAPGV